MNKDHQTLRLIKHLIQEPFQMLVLRVAWWLSQLAKGNVIVEVARQAQYPRDVEQTIWIGTIIDYFT